jgi:hypothetical protein
MMGPKLLIPEAGRGTKEMPGPYRWDQGNAREILEAGDHREVPGAGRVDQGDARSLKMRPEKF